MLNYNSQYVKYFQQYIDLYFEWTVKHIKLNIFPNRRHVETKVWIQTYDCTIQLCNEWQKCDDYRRQNSKIASMLFLFFFFWKLKAVMLVDCVMFYERVQIPIFSRHIFFYSQSPLKIINVCKKKTKMNNQYCISIS